VSSEFKDKTILNLLFDSISKNKALAVIDANSRQVLDVFKTNQSSRLIRLLKGLDENE